MCKGDNHLYQAKCPIHVDGHAECMKSLTVSAKDPVDVVKLRLRKWCNLASGGPGAPKTKLDHCFERKPPLLAPDDTEASLVAACPRCPGDL